MAGGPGAASDASGRGTPLPDTAGPDARSPMGAISGRVLSRAGRPLADCAVVPEATSEPRPPIPELALLTGPDGGFRWSLPSGTYRLTARCPGAAHDGRHAGGRVTGLVVGPGQEITADIVLG